MLDGAQEAARMAMLTMTAPGGQPRLGLAWTKLTCNFDDWQVDSVLLPLGPEKASSQYRVVWTINPAWLQHPSTPSQSMTVDHGDLQ